MMGKFNVFHYIGMAFAGGSLSTLKDNVNMPFRFPIILGFGVLIFGIGEILKRMDGQNK